jgi:prophage antirepressor-like protein
MKNELIPFEFENHEVRGVFIDGQEWLVAKDVCGVLGIVNYRHALETARTDAQGNEYVNFPEDEKGVLDLAHPSGGKQKTLCVNEPGVYRLIHRAHTPQAERFKHMVYHDILPEIRKTGGYSVRENIPLDPRTVREFNAALKETSRRLWLMESENRHLRHENFMHEKIARLEEQLAKKNTRISDSEKKQIEAMSEHLSVSEIAGFINRSTSAIRRAINKGGN